MLAKRHRVFFWVGLLLALNWQSLTAVDLDGPPEFIMVGYLFGSLFAHTTLSSAWMAFGPARLIWRAVLSFAWVFSLPIAIGINVSLDGLPADAVVSLGMCVLGQWVLLQFPFWALALALRLRLQHFDEVNQNPGRERFQFGIRHLLVVMGVASAVIGVGRLVVRNLSARGEEPILIFLAVAAVVLTLPLLLAALMRRLAVLGVALALVLICVATAVEMPLAEMVGAGGAERGHFIAINAVSAILILVVAGTVRVNGYCLCVCAAAGKSRAD